MASGRDNTLNVTAQLHDRVSAPAQEVVKAFNGMANESVKSDDKVAAASDKVARAMKARISASKEVEFAIRAQQAAGQPLIAELVKLEREHEMLAVKMRALSRAGEPIPIEMARQAASARDAASAIREQQQASGAATAASSALSSETKRATEHFSKAAMALSALSGAGQGTASAMTQAAGKVSQIGALMASGGTFGIALGAAALAVAALTAVWEEHNKEMAVIQKTVEAIRANFAKSDDELSEQAKRVAELREQNRLFGLSSEEARLQQLREAVDRRSQTIPGIRDEISARRERIAQMEAEIETLAVGFEKSSEQLQREVERRKQLERLVVEERTLLNAQEHAFKLGQDRLDLNRQEISELEEAILKKRENKDATVAQKEAEKDASKEAATAAADAVRALKYMGAENLRAAQEQQEAIDRIEKERIAAAKVVARERAAAEKQANAEIQASYRASAQEAIGLSNTIGNHVGTALGGIVTGAENAQAAFGAMAVGIVESILDMVVRSIDMYAAQAAAAAFAANAGIPFAGIGMAFGAAAAARIAVLGLKESLGMAQGGLVPGIDTGKDTVPAMLRPGELVLRPEQAEALAASLRSGGPGLISDRLASSIRDTMGVRSTGAPAFMSSGGVVSAADSMGRGVGGVHVNYTVVNNNTVPMGQAALDRQVRDNLLKTFKRLKRAGYAV